MPVPDGTEPVSPVMN